MEVPYKMWIILIENVNYTAENIFNISYNAVIEDFCQENKNNLFEIWKKDGALVEKRMMYNMGMLEKLERFLINNGIYFNWIKYKGAFIGIRIQPTKINFNSYLADCMTLEKFSWHRVYMNIPKIQESKNINTINNTKRIKDGK